MDINNFISYSEKNKDMNNEIIQKCNDLIDGRVCVSFWLHYLLSLKKYLGTECKTYVEIGTLWGGSIACLLMLDNTDNISNVNTHYIGIDLFEGYYGNNCKKNDWNKTSIDIDDKNHLEHVYMNISKFNKKNNKITLIKGSSYDNDTLDKFKKLNKYIDLLFIDGDHSEKGVIADFMKYNIFIKKGGFILFDNYGQSTIWTDVKKGVDSINFDTFDFNIIGELGHSFLIQKK